VVIVPLPAVAPASSVTDVPEQIAALGVAVGEMVGTSLMVNEIIVLDELVQPEVVFLPSA
jgi:hypothetical protein